MVPLAALAAANWAALRQPVPVDFLLFTVSWPLAPVVLGVPILLVAVFLGAALLDRARQLRQLTALERSLDEARKALDRGREAALDTMSSRLEASIAALESVVEGSASGLEARLGARLTALDAHVGRLDDGQREQLEGLVARIARVRDEIAADVGETEEAIVRALRGEAAEPDDVRPALPSSSDKLQG
jgi:DNA anti-recombination protein RmuC